MSSVHLSSEYKRERERESGIRSYLKIQEINHDVPLGSILGPLLFSQFLNDLSNLKSTIVIMAKKALQNGVA